MNRISTDTKRPQLGEPKIQLVRHVLKRIFFDDWMIKLTALVITFALWFGVTGLSTPITKRFTIPLAPSVATDIEIVNNPREEVEIVVSGDKRRVDQISRSDLVATLDLRDVAPGDWVISLSPETISVTLPQGIKLIEVQPGRIPINLEAVEEKDIEVKVVFSGNLAPGLEVYGANVLPARIRVRGPASFIKTLEHVETDPVDIEGRERDFTARQVPVGVSNPKASVLNTVVDVIFRIGERRVERSFSVPIFGFPVPIAGLEGKTAYFTLYGPRTLVMGARDSDFRVDMPQTDGGQPQVVLPPDFENVVEIRKLTVR
ncbi:hypothetical protein BH20ACI2_BH20ACI2_11900 [soil metagenome]